LLIEHLDAKVLPLSICYRCPTKHVELAQALVPQIEPSETAIPGVVEHYELAEVRNQLKDRDLVLCRCNAPLVNLCLSLISSGTKATIKGRDIGKSLTNLAESMKAKSLQELESKLINHRVKEVTKLKEKGRDGMAQALDDRCSCIEYICHRSDIVSIRDLTNFIDQLFSDTTTDGVICSSIHKAKGLESKSVYILFPHLMPLKYATTPEEMQQERNIEYVALTRSQNFLAFITEDPR
jgi:superfamily I DNA/RNA helicase